MYGVLVEGTIRVVNPEGQKSWSLYLDSYDTRNQDPPWDENPSLTTGELLPIILEKTVQILAFFIAKNSFKALPIGGDE